MIMIKRPHTVSVGAKAIHRLRLRHGGMRRLFGGCGGEIGADEAGLLGIEGASP